MSSVIVKENETLDSALRRFKRNWLITNIYPFVEGENGLEALKRDFSRDNLTRLFQRGQTELRLKHRFRKCCIRQIIRHLDLSKWKRE